MKPPKPVLQSGHEYTTLGQLQCKLLGHDWIDIRNYVVESGWWCRRCGRIKAMTPEEEAAPRL